VQESDLDAYRCRRTRTLVMKAINNWRSERTRRVGRARTQTVALKLNWSKSPKSRENQSRRSKPETKTLDSGRKSDRKLRRFDAVDDWQKMRIIVEVGERLTERCDSGEETVKASKEADQMSPFRKV
jgi:hypothetical protein